MSPGRGAGRRPARLLRYAWAAPTTALGLLLAGLARLTGGRARVVEGVLEAHGGAVGWALARSPLVRGGVAAMALGHVVVAQNEAWLERTRTHERVHVAQCERWGPLFVPAYLAASAWAALRGRDPYRDNPFEIEAFARDGERVGERGATR